MNEPLRDSFTEEIPLDALDVNHKSKKESAMDDETNQRLLENINEEDRRPNTNQEANTQDYDFDSNNGDDEYLDDYIFDHSTKGRIKRFLYRLWNGPTQPVDDPAPRIHILMPWEEIPDRIKKNIPRKIRILALILYFLLWFGLCYNILIPYFSHPPQSSNNQDPPILALSCESSNSFWRGKNAACGLNGELCPSIDSGKDVLFRCPALCDRGSWVYSLAPIGDQRVRYRGYFVGGGEYHDEKNNQLSHPYRADSFPCGAGVHAGLISPFFGGCARVSFDSKSQSSFPSTKGNYGVSDSIDFNSFFPNSYFFKTLKLQKDEFFSHCYDPRLLILIVNIILGIPIVYLASGCVMYWAINIVGFWTICLATDPPVTVDAMDPETYSHLLSIGLERFLPTCFILYVLWHTSSKRTFDTFPEESNMKHSPLTRLFLWYPLFWLGVLNNISFDRLPVDRLTIEDLKRQPGGFLAVGSIIFTILTCAIIQAYKIWLSGRFKKYINIYFTFIFSLIIISQLPGLTLRIHHYILAMLLIPGCATRGRTAIMFQGILFGLFLSGVSRWGLAAIAETATSLNRDDPSGKILPPELLEFNKDSGILSWANIPSDKQKYTLISLLINDIERYVADKVDSVNIKELFTNSQLMTDMINAAMTKNEIKDEQGSFLIFLRIGRKIPDSNVYSDFSNAAILKWPSGEFIPPKPGVT